VDGLAGVGGCGVGLCGELDKLRGVVDEEDGVDEGVEVGELAYGGHLPDKVENGADCVDGRFVAGTCHEDVEDSLEERWEVFDYGGQLGGVKRLLVIKKKNMCKICLTHKIKL